MSQNKISKALSQADETQFLKIGEGILKEIPDIFKTQFPGKKGVVVSDKTTYAVAGKEVDNGLSAVDLAFCEPLILDDPDLYANYHFVQKVKSFLASRDAIALAIGSGVVNDLTKLASHELGRSYMCVATAASMDGYAAFGASITKDGAKQTLMCA